MMTVENSGVAPATANFAFSAFLFSVFGWALLETQLFNAAAGVGGHLFISAFGLAITAIALRRCRLWWPLFADAGEGAKRSSTRDHIGDVIGCVALVAAGCVLGLSAKTGSIALFAICAGAFSLVPWSRIGLCRRHFFISCAMLGTGAASILVVARDTRHPLIYLLWAWIFWVIALSELLVTWNRNRDRPAISRPEPIQPVELQSSGLADKETEQY
jgi:hypothetical protein